ncbi:hypothetical protein GCM10010909_25340 [Acidocella aquatica]|uniref:Type I restriction modification DNA specificity domain-containing protein n=1 Tax=Acidocella aquatica TaxID=1922313 RepID=A0ABQ6A881_9PROT|nr:restriction endonuclease subunit S [Acidocella aquatica]GLR67853.1 hypothetical protein GCM10010909_25340 [Acidocella aquatica]
MVKAGYKQTEIGVIPEDWDVLPLGQIFDVQLGKMLDEEKNVGILKNYLGNRAVQWGTFDLSDLPKMRMSGPDLIKFRLKEGDILACEGGEVGRAAIWDAPIEECYFQKALHRLRAMREFDHRLMLSLLKSYSERGVFVNYTTQTSIAHLPREKFILIPIPVPSRPEQHAIATALSDADALIASLDALIAKKRDLKQAAMQQLLTGKTRLPGFKGEWDMKTLGDYGDFKGGNGFPLKFQGNVSGELPFFKVSDMNNEGNSMFMDNSNHWISDDTSPDYAGLLASIA